MNYFVTAIGTDCGKTIASAILCEALQADYWKPVQAGYPRDADTVKGLVSNSETIIHPERFLLKTPASPHAAAKVDNISINLEDFRTPVTPRDLIIEGAGGCLVPLNEKDFVIDIAGKNDAVIVLVANLYLGSINHTLMTFEILNRRNCKIKGIIFNGTPNQESQHIILHHTKLKCLLHILPEQELNAKKIKEYANKLKEIGHE